MSQNDTYCNKAAQIYNKNITQINESKTKQNILYIMIHIDTKHGINASQNYIKQNLMT